MIITLIGMLNCGKTHWAKRLHAEQGLQWIGCDSLIEERLECELDKLGAKGISGVARWLGFPADPCYEEREQKYLQCEKEVMQQIVQTLERSKNTVSQQLVIDTSGSVIYIGEEILRELKKHSRIVYLDTPFSVLGEMLKSFLEHPKPVVWGGLFQKGEAETDQQTLRRCYPKLLHFRSLRYEQYADVKLAYEFHKGNASSEEFLKEALHGEDRNKVC